MIRVSNVSVFLGRNSIVEDVSFDAQAGAFTVIVGPNGSGKTTLMRALSGDLPHEGVISINGTPINRLKLWQMATMRAILPQSTSLSFPFTVREIVKLGMTSGRSGASRHNVDTLPDEALERVDLAGLSGTLWRRAAAGATGARPLPGLATDAGRPAALSLS